MALRQLSVMVNNEKGELARVTRTLAEAGVNLKAMSIADTEHFGILRVIVNDTEKAMTALKSIGCLTRITEVVGVKISDQPGKLAEALDVLSRADINMEYLYAFCARTEKHAYMVLRVTDNAAAEAALEAVGLHLITDADVNKL